MQTKSSSKMAELCIKLLRRIKMNYRQLPVANFHRIAKNHTTPVYILDSESKLKKESPNQ
jgi:hypothetical protein